MNTPDTAQADHTDGPDGPDGFHVYDTTLRDGAQQEGLNLSVADKLTIARHIDGLGVGVTEPTE